MNETCTARNSIRILGSRPGAAVGPQKVVKFEILGTESAAFEGRSFGVVGPTTGFSHALRLRLLPSDSHNSIIVDIDRAPRNSQGLVEAASDVKILRPTIAANGNHHLWYEVVNRGPEGGPALFKGSGIVNEAVHRNLLCFKTAR